MASLPIYDRTGAKVGDYEIAPSDLAVRISKQLLHDAVVMYQANQRQGSHKSKTRGEVAGSTKKMYRQKGTGNARAGSRRSGVRRGGGHIHAKSPRDYSYRLPRKALQAATRMALASKLRDDQVVVIDELSFAQPRTKEMVAVLKALGLAGSTALVATESLDVNVYKSARNIGKVSVAPVSELNAYSVLAPRKLLVTKAALDAIREKHGSTAVAS
ncbi:MAG: 50S ribosomal protein L4 [Planctomycetia bacterium]|nr:50S ribosomal protein L4 [Planctomycetia bacterium]